MASRLSLQAAVRIFQNASHQRPFCYICREDFNTISKRKIGTQTVLRKKYTLKEMDPMSTEENEYTERWELLQLVKGVEDPFQMSAKTVTAGTKEEPTVIPTIYDQRTVGCVCAIDSPVIRWMRLHVGENKKCECGYWFKLVPLDE